MPTLFGRPAPGPVSAFFDGFALGNADSQAIGYTWINDGNVSPERQASVLAEIGANGGRVPEGCTAHFAAKVRAGDYDDPTQNGANVLDALPRDQYLATIVWLTSPGFLRLVRDGGFIPAQSMEDRDIGRWRGLIQDVSSASPGERRSFLTELITAASGNPTREDRPTWSTFWRAIEPVVTGPTWADDVRDALGLHHVSRGETLVVLRYEVGAVGRLIRPCCLDLRWYPWFFCSPSARIEAGFAMSLSSQRAMVPEVIHRPHQLDIEMWTGHFGQTARDPSNDLTPLRRRHHAALQKAYGAELKMPAP